KFVEAVLIEDRKIKAIGTNDEILATSDIDEKIDCQGKTVIPGINDSHMHIFSFAETMYQAQISGCKSIDEMIEICKKYIAENPDRVKNGLYAQGWNQDLFEDSDRMPNRFDLDKISTEIPIVLDRVCGHILATNTKAIEVLGLDGNSPQYNGGTFEIGEDGYPNGVFTENACNFAKDIIPRPDIEERRKMFIEASEYAAEHGVTTVQSNDLGTIVFDYPVYFKLFKDIYDSGEGIVRYRHQISFNTVDQFKEYINGELANGKYDEDSLIQLGPLKLFKDGSLGARTALLREDYNDDPGNRGLTWMNEEEMDEFCKVASEAGIQVATHVIGDAAIEQTIDSYEKTFGEEGNKLRHALIHCQITDKALLERIAKLGIVVSYQPIFLDYDMHVVENRCGKELSSTSYAFKTLGDLGGKIAYGTDCPVEDCNPFPNIYSAVTRKDSTGFPEGGFYPEECVDVYTAIDAYTEGSAYMEFMEGKKGRIKPGQLADIVVLDKDIFTCDPMEIRDILPVMTMIDGKVVYRKEI
ncbi:MAG: amidohydrolase, partial [Intestinibacter sp.]|uniref:amidohydrolase n=1 Tax=Intestinibacter sp. TaxID=1965304 RepID=UPI0025C57E4C